MTARKMTDDMITTARRMHAQGRHVADIARNLKVTASAIRPYLRMQSPSGSSNGHPIILHDTAAVWMTKPIGKGLGDRWWSTPWVG